MFGNLSLLLLTSLLPTLVSRQSSLVQSETATSANCSGDILPPAVQTQLEARYASWKIQDVFTLSPSARSSWEDEKYPTLTSCPGIAIGRFEDDSVAYAV